MKYFVAELLLVSYFVFLCSLARGEIVEAENYNQGGEGIAYHDTTSENIGDAGIRTDEGVDLWVAGDETIKIGSTVAGEWITWTYNFPATGEYTFTFYTGTPNDDTTFALVVTGTRYVVNVPNNGNYHTDGVVSQSVDVTKVGSRSIKITVLGPSFDLDKFEIVNAEVDQMAEAYTYVSTTDKQWQVAWDSVLYCYYKFRVYNLERDVYLPIGEDGGGELKLTDTTTAMNFPYSGHFVPQVKACRQCVPDPNDENGCSSTICDGGDCEEVCSTWSKSIDKEVSVVKGADRGWWLYGYLAPAGEIIIE